MKYSEQWLLYLALNILFIWKYMSRTAYSPLIGIVIYLLLFCIAAYALHLSSRWSEQQLKAIVISIIAISCVGIALLLLTIDPLSVNVDRWSATTYFLDGLFSGKYPYGIHTHVCETNYPSPSPLWYYLNIPFWLIGDVGTGLFFYLLLLVTAVRWFTQSWQQTLIFTLLLLMSPAYWWEVIVRSDSLSNCIIIFAVLLLLEKRHISFSNHSLSTSILCGMIAMTRLWAPIAPAIYLSKSYFQQSHMKKILIFVIILLTMFFFFTPYIFWDTENWIFFQRNPFMSETSTGNPWILLIMIGIALILAFKYKNFNQYCRSTACFFTLFFIVSLLYNHLAYNSDISFFEDADFDISYLSLALPYILFSISQSRICNEKYY